MSDPTLRVLIVDDEPLARGQLRRLLAADPQVSVLRECDNGRDAVSAISELRPDLVLLDVQMPELDGFSVVAALPSDAMPEIVFVTAYDEYALRAFDVHALDYVLKPVDRDRLLLAVGRARQRRAAPGTAARETSELQRLVAELAARRPPERLAIRVDGKHLVLQLETIDWLEAVDDYVRVHVGRTTHLVRGTLQGFAARLPAQFLRIHRSAIINTNRLREVSVTEQGDYRVTLQDGTRLPSGRSYRAVVAELLRSLAVDHT